MVQVLELLLDGGASASETQVLASFEALLQGMEGKEDPPAEQEVGLTGEERGEGGVALGRFKPEACMGGGGGGKQGERMGSVEVCDGKWGWPVRYLKSCSCDPTESMVDVPHSISNSAVTPLLSSPLF